MSEAVNLVIVGKPTSDDLAQRLARIYGRALARVATSVEIMGSVGVESNSSNQQPANANPSISEICETEAC